MSSSIGAGEIAVIVGIVCLCVVFLAAVGAGIYFLTRNRSEGDSSGQ